MDWKPKNDTFGPIIRWFLPCLETTISPHHSLHIFTPQKIHMKPEKMMLFHALVGGFNHLGKYEFVNGKDDIPYITEKNV